MGWQVEPSGRGGYLTGIIIDVGLPVAAGTLDDIVPRGMWRGLHLIRLLVVDEPLVVFIVRWLGQGVGRRWPSSVPIRILIR